MNKNNDVYAKYSDLDCDDFKYFSRTIRDNLYYDYGNDCWFVSPQIFKENCKIWGNSNNPVKWMNQHISEGKEFYKVEFYFAGVGSNGMIIRQPIERGSRRRCDSTEVSILILSPTVYEGDCIENYYGTAEIDNAPIVVLNLAFENNNGCRPARTLYIYEILENNNVDMNKDLLNLIADNFHKCAYDLVEDFLKEKYDCNCSSRFIHKLKIRGYEYDITYPVFFSYIQDIMEIEEDRFPSKYGYEGRYMMLREFDNYLKKKPIEYEYVELSDGTIMEIDPNACLYDPWNNIDEDAIYNM